MLCKTLKPGSKAVNEGQGTLPFGGERRVGFAVMFPYLATLRLTSLFHRCGPGLDLPHVTMMFPINEAN